MAAEEVSSFDSWAARIAALPADLPEAAWPPPGWTLYRDGDLEIVYAPCDWTNTAARVALVGITPGRYQAWKASMEARSALLEGVGHEEARRRANRVASFSGPMRRNLVEMLDRIGLAEKLGIASSGDLFAEAHDLAALVSALAFPVFIAGRNYTGARITTTPVLVHVIRDVLAHQLHDASKALVIPLGNAASAAVELLVREDLLDSQRCVLGFPHPSGANGHRIKQFEARLDSLTETLQSWRG